jgi:signal transduction histidine kinase
VKNADDASRGGLMLCREDGRVVFANERMRRLMTAVTGTVQRSGRQFYGMLTLGECCPGCEILWFEGQSVCKLPDGSAWMFTMSAVRVKGKTYRQIAAAEISERLKLTTELWEKNRELARRQAELNQTIANLEVLSRAQETQRAKLRTHDILGERLTLMLRNLRGERELAYAALRAMSGELLDELKTAKNELPPQDRLDVLTRVFAAAGVQVRFDGSMPEDAARAGLIADAAREAVTNAVRHGLATRVHIRAEETGSGVRVRITDNGRPPPGPVTEGCGIGGMRAMAASLGGRVTVTVSPRFMLEVFLPGGGGRD